MNDDQVLVFGEEFTTGNEYTLPVEEIAPKSRTQDRYFFRNLKNYIVKTAKSFKFAAIKCFKTYTNFGAFIPNVSRKVRAFGRFWKENGNPLVFFSRIGEFWIDWTIWTRKKHRFFDFYIWGLLFAISSLIMLACHDPVVYDYDSGMYIDRSFLDDMGTPFFSVMSVCLILFIQQAWGINNLYRKLINMTRKYPIVVALVEGVLAIGISLCFTIGKADFWKAIMIPAAVSLGAYVYIYVDCSFGLLSRFLFRKSDDGSNAFISNLKGLLYLLPALIPMVVFTFYPMINAILMGFVRFNSDFIFTEWSFLEFLKRVFTDPKFQANNLTFEWFVSTLQDPAFYHSLITTVVIVIITVPISTGISVVIAVLMNSIKKFQGLYQTIYFLPYVTAMTAVTSVWRLILNENGILNLILGSSTNWLNSPDPMFIVGSYEYLGISGGSEFYGVSKWAYQAYPQLIGFIIYSIWDGLAFKIVIFLTGLQGIDKQVYQAAQLDGSTKLRTFRKITLPLLAPIMLFITTTSMIGAFKTYTSTKSLFLNNPRFETIVFYMFKYIDGTRTAYDKASAVGVILFIIIMSFTGLRTFLKNHKKAKNDVVKVKKVKGRKNTAGATKVARQGGGN